MAELRSEIEQRLTGGRCAYCGRPARPDRPLTREHAIPRSRGAGRREWRVIVPACGECNRQRGAHPLAAFLAAAPTRIARLLDYFASLPPGALQQVDLRVFAEVLAATLLVEELAGLTGRELSSSERLVRRRRQKARRLLERLRHRLGGETRATARAYSGVPLPHAPALRDLAAVLAIAWGAWEGELGAELALLQSETRSGAAGAVRLAGVLPAGRTAKPRAVA